MGIKVGDWVELNQEKLMKFETYVPDFYQWASAQEDTCFMVRRTGPNGCQIDSPGWKSSVVWLPEVYFIKTDGPKPKLKLKPKIDFLSITKDIVGG